MFTLQEFKNGHFNLLVVSLLVDEQVKTYESVFTKMIEKLTWFSVLNRKGYPWFWIRNS